MNKMFLVYHIYTVIILLPSLIFDFEKFVGIYFVWLGFSVIMTLTWLIERFYARRKQPPVKTEMPVWFYLSAPIGAVGPLLMVIILSIMN